MGQDLDKKEAVADKKQESLANQLQQAKAHLLATEASLAKVEYDFQRASADLLQSQGRSTGNCIALTGSQRNLIRPCLQVFLGKRPSWVPAYIILLTKKKTA